jgi:hypothetical protein
MHMLTQKLDEMYSSISVAFASFASYVGTLDINESMVKLYTMFKDVIGDASGRLTELARQAFRLLSTFATWMLPYGKTDPTTEKEEGKFTERVKNTTDTCDIVDNIFRAQGQLLQEPWYTKVYNRTEESTLPNINPLNNTIGLPENGSTNTPSIGTLSLKSKSSVQKAEMRLRPPRFGYTSARGRIARVNYEVEGCEEEDE